MTSLMIPCPACGRELKLRDRTLLGRKGKCPKCGHAFVMLEPEEVNLELAEPEAPATGTAARWVPEESTPPVPPVAPAPTVASAAFPVEAAPLVAAPPVSGSARVLASRQRGRSRSWISVIIGVIILGGAGGVGYAVWTKQPKKSIKNGAGTVATRNDVEEGTASPSETGTFSLAASPTKGSAIPLEMIPSGAQILVHLRPADLWAADGPGEEVRYCLGPLGEFVEQQLKTRCHKPPQDVEEVLFAWIANARGTPPSMAMVVRLKEEAKKSELLEMVGGDRVDTYGRPVYVDAENAGLILDLKTFAIGPAKDVEDMVNSIGGRAAFSTGIETIMEKTDRQRHVTIVFEPTAVLLDQEFLVPTNARALLRESMDWFGDDAEAVAWSLHLESDRFYSDMTIRCKTTIRPAALAERMTEKLGALPKTILGLVQAMSPPEVGKRKLIGRLPAMWKVAALATQATTMDARFVRLVTPLPDRAAPNLTLATLLAWDESTRTDFNKKPTPGGSAEPPRSTISVADRLKKKIDVDFRRTPLQEAFAYIADETKVKIDIDGDALKLAGYTKNMPQEFKLDQVSGMGAIAEILKKYDKMCLVIDEKKNEAVIMTFPVAEAKGLKPTTPTP